MTEPPKRFLPLFNPDGRQIARPDLYLLARMAFRDSEPDGDNAVSQVHEAMVRADNTTASLNVFEADIAKRQIAGDLRQRLFAATVLASMVRIRQATGLPPAVSTASRLAGFHYHLQNKSSSSAGAAEEADKAFAAFRNTSHLQAAWEFGDKDLEASDEGLGRFLALARGFELYMDGCIPQMDRRFAWDPWRVPTFIPPITRFPFLELTPEERAVIGLKA